MLFVALAWIFGAGSLVLFGLFLWTGSLQLIHLGLSGSSLLGYDSALCLIFFLQHSILIRRSVRSSLEKLIPEYCQGVAYTITSGLVLVALVLFWQPSTTSLYVLQGTGRLVMRVLLILAFAGFFWGIRSLKRFDAFGIDVFLAHTRGEEIPVTPLTVMGPYRFVRHPFYAFAVVALWATPVLSLDRLVFNVLFTGWIILGASLEERDLMEEFGAGYAQYRNVVPMFVPRIWALRRQVLKTKGASGGRAA